MPRHDAVEVQFSDLCDESDFGVECLKVFKVLRLI